MSTNDPAEHTSGSASGFVSGVAGPSPTMSREARISRVERSKDQARATYDRLSRWYDLLEWPFERSCVRVGLQMVDVRVGEKVLEVGFGTGHALVALARAVGATGNVCGIDLAPGMRTVAQRRVDQAGMADRVDLTCGDAVALPYTTGQFDAVFMSFTLELFDTPEIATVLAQCRRVLRKGGRIGVVALAQRDHPTVSLRLYEWAHRRLPTFVDCRPIYPVAALEATAFRVTAERERWLFGLPVACLVATKTT